MAARWPWNRRSRPTSLAENIDGMPEDDDLNFALLALSLVEQHGRRLTTRDVAQAWLDDLPAGRVFTAERVAYRNLLPGSIPPDEPPDVATRSGSGSARRSAPTLYGWAHPGDRCGRARLPTSTRG